MWVLSVLTFSPVLLFLKFSWMKTHSGFLIYEWVAKSVFLCSLCLYFFKFPPLWKISAQTLHGHSVPPAASVSTVVWLLMTGQPLGPPCLSASSAWDKYKPSPLWRQSDVVRPRTQYPIQLNMRGWFGQHFCGNWDRPVGPVRRWRVYYGYGKQGRGNYGNWAGHWVTQ